MSLTLAGALIGLSLIDSTSFGTLLIPIWLLLTPGHLRPSRIAVYLGTVAVFYFATGVLLTLGADAALQAARDAFSDVSPTVLRWCQLVAGVLVIALSYWLEARARRRGGSPGRVQRWRARAMEGTSGPAGLMSLALVAAGLEVATMLPYLGAVGLIANSDMSWQLTGATLAGYCVVMTVPALVLTTARFTAHTKVDPLLQRMNDWLTKNSAKALGWTVGGIGIGLTLNAIVTLATDS